MKHLFEDEIEAVATRAAAFAAKKRECNEHHVVPEIQEMKNGLLKWIKAIVVVEFANAVAEAQHTCGEPVQASDEPHTKEWDETSHAVSLVPKTTAGPASRCRSHGCVKRRCASTLAPFAHRRCVAGSISLGGM